MDKIKEIRKKFNDVVSAYVDIFCEKFDVCKTYTYWIGGEYGVGLFSFNDEYAITLDDMIYILENDVKPSEYYEYIDYISMCIDCNFKTMNLKSWHEGAPRIPQESFDRIMALRKDIDELCKTTNENF